MAEVTAQEQAVACGATTKTSWRSIATSEAGRATTVTRARRRSCYSVPNEGIVTHAGTMRVFIAGATGVLGRHLIPQFSARGHEVIGLARDDVGLRAVAAAGGGDGPQTFSMLTASRGRQRGPRSSFMRRPRSRKRPGLARPTGRSTTAFGATEPRL